MLVLYVIQEDRESVEIDIFLFGVLFSPVSYILSMVGIFDIWYDLRTRIRGKRMKVILKQDVNKIGKKGELLEVADGYGRNFLIARGLADEATEGKVRSFSRCRRLRR